MYLFSEKGYYPCCDCAKIIVQSEIKEIIIASAIIANTDKYNFDPSFKMFDAANININLFDFKKLSEEFLFVSKEIKSYIKNQKLLNLEGKINLGSTIV
jgi:deoxycytidylate deaminase